jgi:pantoate--beta-alanine ligase
MSIVRSRRALARLTARWKREGEVIGVVPTMGALHAGHLSLVRRAKAQCRRVIVTLFVNPRQFDNAADLAAYPRTERSDWAMLKPLGIDVLYAPPAAEIYPSGHCTTVSVAGFSRDLEGRFRPGHFDGVATVVAKLFLQTGADRAYFGEKDFQQLALVTRMAADLDIPVRVIACPTIREPDGLAMSSRNRRLSPAARDIAPALAANLFEAARRIEAGGSPAACLRQAHRRILAAGFAKVEYVELRSAADLSPLARVDRPARILAAAWLDGVRLIDNVKVAAR